MTTKRPKRPYTWLDKWQNGFADGYRDKVVQSNDKDYLDGWDMGQFRLHQEDWLDCGYEDGETE